MAYKITTHIECNDPKEVAALASALAVFVQVAHQTVTMRPAPASAGAGSSEQPQPAADGEPPTPAKPDAAAEHATRAEQLAKARAAQAAKRAAAKETASPKAANGNGHAPSPREGGGKPLTEDAVRAVLNSWAENESKRLGLKIVGNAIPPSVIDAAKAIFQRVCGVPIKTLSEIPAEKYGEVVAAFTGTA